MSFTFAAMESSSSRSSSSSSSVASSSSATMSTFDLIVAAIAVSDHAELHALLKNFNVDEQDKRKQTILMHAVMHDNLRSVELILQRNPNLALKDADGDTAKDCARNFEYSSILTLLEQHEALAAKPKGTASKASAPSTASLSSSAAVSSPVPSAADLKTLSLLEEENRKLKIKLAEHEHKEVEAKVRTTREQQENFRISLKYKFIAALGVYKALAEGEVKPTSSSFETIIKTGCTLGAVVAENIYQRAALTFIPLLIEKFKGEIVKEKMQRVVRFGTFPGAIPQRELDIFLDEICMRIGSVYTNQIAKLADEGIDLLTTTLVDVILEYVSIHHETDQRGILQKWVTAPSGDPIHFTKHQLIYFGIVDWEPNTYWQKNVHTGIRTITGQTWFVQGVITKCGVIGEDGTTIYKPEQPEKERYGYRFLFPQELLRYGYKSSPTSTSSAGMFGGESVASRDLLLKPAPAPKATDPLLPPPSKSSTSCCVLL